MLCKNTIFSQYKSIILEICAHIIILNGQADDDLLGKVYLCTKT